MKALLRTKDKWTKGISVTNNTNDLWFFFFEIDRPFSSKTHDRINSVYNDYSLDYLNHRSGNGEHWFSPSLVTKEEYKEIRSHLKDINPMCPMWTLRYEPNKYVNEKEIWFNSSSRFYHDNILRNSIELSNLLNKWFFSIPDRCKFKGTVHTDLKMVKYRFKD